MSAPVHRWMVERPPRELERATARLARTPGVLAVALMPDAHVSEDVCVGTVTITDGTILPGAVGGDIGCGMVAVPLEGELHRLAQGTATRVLEAWSRAVPGLMHPSASAPPLPDALASEPLSAPALEKLKAREGRTELGTVGRGNHFVELQIDERGAPWILVHTGSRAIGPAIRAHHESRGAPRSRGDLVALAAGSVEAERYVADAAWAGHWARQNRARIADLARDVVADVLRLPELEGPRIEVDHNHVRRELHGDRWVWVHRKGAMGLDEGELGVVPGSMGTATFHVAGRGCADAFRSSAHGAGRALARGEARRAISTGRLLDEVRGVFFDVRRAGALRDEAPSAYKDVDAVMRAQRELVRVVRRLRPLLSYKVA